MSLTEILLTPLFVLCILVGMGFRNLNVILPWFKKTKYVPTYYIRHDLIAKKFWRKTHG